MWTQVDDDYYSQYYGDPRTRLMRDDMEADYFCSQMRGVPAFMDGHLGSGVPAFMDDEVVLGSGIIAEM